MTSESRLVDGVGFNGEAVLHMICGKITEREGGEQRLDHTRRHDSVGRQT